MSSTESHSTALSREDFNILDVPASLQSITPFLRIASEIEQERPRIAFICRFYAFEKAHRLDSLSIGTGVRQFKSSLMQKLARDNASSVAARVKETDAQETESFYRQYYDQYISLVDQEYQADRAQLGKLHQTSGVLFEVLCCANKEKVYEVSPEALSRL